VTLITSLLLAHMGLAEYPHRFSYFPLVWVIVNSCSCSLVHEAMNYSEENNLQPNSSFEKLFPFLFSNENSLSSKSEETGEQSLTTHELKRKFDQLRNKPSNLPGIKKVKQLQMTYE